MRVRRAGLWWALAACGPLMLVGAGIGAVLSDAQLPGGAKLIQNVYPNVVFGALMPLLGALVLSRFPKHPIGLLFLGCGLSSAATFPVYGYAHLALYEHPGLPAGVAAAWVSSWIWTLGFAPLVSIGVLLFPDGQLPSRRWRWLLYSDAVAIALMAGTNALRPGPLENHHIADNPLGVPLPGRIFEITGSVGFSLFLVGLLGSGVSTFVRWRRATVSERTQLSWFALAVLLLVVGVALPRPAALTGLMAVVAMPLLPISIAVGILRRNLYGIEVVVRRSLVYATLTALLLVTYAGTVAALGALLQGRADSTIALVATALVAIAFAPARERLQRAADRLLYGDRHDPYRVLTGMSRDAPALSEVAETVASSLRLPYSLVEVFGDPPLSADWGTPSAVLHEVPLTFRGDPVGRLLVAPRTPRDPFSATDLRLLDDLGRQIAVAAHAMLLTQALQQSRQGLVETREDERRRIRRDLHDGLGPALAGVALGLDAVNRLAHDDPGAAALLAEQLKLEVQTSLTDVRRLVEDLRPPALDQLGLVDAVRQQAERLTERDPRLAVEVEGDAGPSLPAAVEVAAYRIATEALNNVSRHAGARHCRVGIGLGDQELLVTVEDDGVGLPYPPRPGVGLAAMRERAIELGGSCEAAGRDGGGTRVVAHLPVVS